MYALEKNLKIILLIGNHGRNEVSFTVIASVPGGSRYLAQMMKGEEKINELGKKTNQILSNANFTFFIFEQYSLNPGENGEIICTFLYCWIQLLSNLFPWTSLEKLWALTIKARSIWKDLVG